MKNMIFKRTWCDYLTPCPYRDGIEIGSYECSECHHNGGFEDHGKVKPGEYFSVAQGCVRCNFPEKSN